MYLRWTCTALLLAFVCFFWAVTTFAQQPPEFRGLWADGFNSAFKTPSQVTQYIADARAGHLNAVVAEVRKRGDAYYNSNFEPKASDILSTFDPLQDLITKAHDTSGGKARIEVHAWIVSYPIWNNLTNAPPQVDHPYNLHPDWLSETSTGSLWDGNNYVFDPGHPEVQKHIYNVAMDIISRYDVDGLNLDYIRYSSKSWGYNPVTVQRFNTLFNRTGNPATTDAAWLQFRRDQVTALVRKIYLNAAAAKPMVKISADTICFAPGVTTDSAWLSSSAAYTDKLQDWRGWMQEGILDLNLPMMYFDQTVYPTAWANWSLFAKDRSFNRHVALGLGIWLNTISDTAFQIRTVRNNTPSGNHADGASLYAYSDTNNENVSRADFFNALITPTVYDTNPTPAFVDVVAPPEMPWKTAPTKGHIKGFVLAMGDNAPLDGARVVLSGGASRTQTNDATGFFGFVDLNPGSYTLTITFPGYNAASTNVTVSAGLVTTADVYLSASTAPIITFQPQNVTILPGSNATFSVTATGALPLSYRWKFNGANIAGATASSYTRTNVTFSHAGAYTVTVTNALGSTNSTPAILTVVTTAIPPILITQPLSKIGLAGNNITLQATADGTAPFSWRWRKNGANVSGATSSSLFLSNMTPASAGNYTVIVTNTAGAVTSAVATVSVHYALNLSFAGGGTGMLSKSPDAPSYAPGTVVTLTASNGFTGWTGDASGSANPLSVTMNSHKNLAANFTGVEVIVDNTAANVVGTWNTGTTAGFWGSNYHWKGPGTGNSHLTFRPSLPVAGKYNVYEWHVIGSNRAVDGPHVVSYNGGSATHIINQTTGGSTWNLLGTYPFLAGTNGYARIHDGYTTGVALMADAIRFLFVHPPVILTPPQGDTILAGANATFSVTAVQATSYQWRFNSGNISGATGSSYTRTNAQISHAGNYTVVVTGPGGSVTSSVAALVVGALPSFTAHPASQTNSTGSNVLFSATATGSAPLEYQWRFGGSELPNATSATLTLTNAQLADAGIYSVVVRNPWGGALSSNALLTLLRPTTLQSTFLFENGQIRVQLNGEPGFTNVVESSSTLTNNWTPLTNLVLTNGAAEFLEPSTNAPSRFYRARRLP
jgi:uncharacterized lipoprotein YddW (UPF0748 family)